MKPLQQAVNKVPTAENFYEKILTVLSRKYFPFAPNTHCVF